jgi:hypothetical protein
MNRHEYTIGLSEPVIDEDVGHCARIFFYIVGESVTYFLEVEYY